MKEIKNNKKNRHRAFRTFLTLLPAFTVILSMSAASFAWLGDTAEVSSQKAPASASEETTDGSDSTGDSDASNGDAEAAVNGGSESNENEEGVTEETTRTEEGEEGEVSAQEETGGEDADADDMMAADPFEGCEFTVSYDASKYESVPASFENGVLTIQGDVTVTMAERKTSTTQRIVVADSCKVTLNGVTIEAAEKSGPGILIQAESNVDLVLAKGSTNNITGAHGTDINATSGGYAGIEVEFLFEEGDDPSNKMASLTISGSGTLNATGGHNSAGIGGSNSMNGSRGRGLYGNITINGGTINATSPGGGAGIGSSNNPNGGTSIGSYKATGKNSWGTITINGGDITAESKGSGAGIGGGNHVDSSKIIINDGNVKAYGAAGIGCGLGSSSTDGSTVDKGPGYYWADVEIHGGTILAKATGDDNWGGSGIGGGAYCDAEIVITGGNITAYGGKVVCNEPKQTHNCLHHGGAGIGGGYEGQADITITGGTIKAYVGENSTAAAIGSGGTPNSNSARGTTGRTTAKDSDGNPIIHLQQTTVTITGGDITADATQGRGGAGIGAGTGADKVTVNISGGTILAEGAKSCKEDKIGGAGIGGGLYAKDVTIPGRDTKEKAKYQVETDIDITITGGDIVAIGGWGASGIGSGALNKMANQIDITAKYPGSEGGAEIQAYSDGTKFAIDTRNLHENGITTSQANDEPNTRIIDGYVLQGTFVHNYKGEGDAPDQSPEGLKSIVVGNDGTGETKELTRMPEGYRSYATNVSEAGVYTVYTDAEAIGEGGGRYFSQLTTDRYDADEAEEQGKLVQYDVNKNQLSDNFYLFPVKSVVVEKKVQSIDGASIEGLNTKAYFGVCFKNENDENEFVKNKDNSIWTESIEIKDGVPQGKAYFVNLDDRKYDVREITSGDNTDSPIDSKFGSLTLKRITTQHGDIFGLNEGGAHGLIISTSEDGDKLVINVESVEKEEQTSITLSLFANDDLLEDTSSKIDKDHSWKATWTVPKTSADGEVIEYKVGDTSNNATIDSKNWSDEVRIINTYEGEGIELKITKAIENYLDANNGETKKTANATFVFNVEAKNSAGTIVYENYVSITFDGYGEAKSEVLAIKGVTGIEEITVTEVYKAGYKMAEGSAEKQKIKLTGEGAAEKNEDGQYEFSFANEYDDTVVEGSGALNRYENKQYVTKASGQEEEPAA
ncbi:MAG: hypothetical protein J5961_06055 [Mogibacterium sp.]|nr:hypothetical protein [Mogibacterium sp.]